MLLDKNFINEYLEQEGKYTVLEPLKVKSVQLRNKKKVLKTFNNMSELEYYLIGKDITLIHTAVEHLENKHKTRTLISNLIIAVLLAIIVLV